MALEIRRLHLASLQGVDGQYAEPASDHLPPGQASDGEAWRESVRRIRSLRPETVHFCHHTDLVHS
jgi:hypothetical protein